VVVPPGERVIVQEPVAGNPVKTTLPVAIEQVGWVTVPTVGAAGNPGCALITIFAEACEIHPEELVTVNV
jgi:hypothetical protein